MQETTILNGIYNADDNVLFKVTDVLKGNRYFVQDMGSYYELHFPVRDGYVEIEVDREEDFVDVADEQFEILTQYRSQSVAYSEHIELSTHEPIFRNRICQLTEDSCIGISPVKLVR
jgi:hypothetical protein